MRTLPPLIPCAFLLASISEHTIDKVRACVLPWSLSESSSLCFLHLFHILIHVMLPPIVRRVDCGHFLLPYGWITRAPLYPPHPLVTSPSHSLMFNYLDDQAKQAIKDAAGSGVFIAL